MGRGTMGGCLRAAGRRRIAALLSAGLATLVACAALAGPASAAEVGSNIIAVLPDTSGLELAAFPGSAALQVDVLRSGVHMATANVVTDSLGAAAVNGGTLGCWSDATPDILPGDTIHVTGPGVDASMTVAPVTVTRAVATGPTTLVVHGTATAPDGSPLPVAGLEARIIGTSADRFSNGRRDLRAGAAGKDGTLAYNGADGSWTATFFVATSDVPKALAAVDVRGIGADATLTQQTIAQAPVARGPAPPCSTPLRRDAVTRASRPAVNAADAAADLTLSGVASDASDVTVTLDDEDPATAPVMAFATLSAPAGPQTFTALVPGDDILKLSDGTLTASATFTVAGVPIGGTTLQILKDTVAPPAPTATPGPATYTGAQAVALEDADGEATIHWTAAGGFPTVNSPAYTGQIQVTSSQTIRAVAVDRAGNAGPVATFAFTIVPPVTIAAATTASATPSPPATSGSASQKSTSQAAAAAALQLRSLAAPTHIGAGRLRAGGLPLALRLPRAAVLVRVRVLRAGRRGRALATVYRLAPAGGTTLRVRLRDRAVRRLAPGRYVLEITPGRSRAALGRPTRAPLTVTR